MSSTTNSTSPACGTLPSFAAFVMNISSTRGMWSRNPMPVKAGPAHAVDDIISSLEAFPSAARATFSAPDLDQAPRSTTSSSNSSSRRPLTPPSWTSCRLPRVEDSATASVSLVDERAYDSPAVLELESRATMNELPLPLCKPADGDRLRSSLRCCGRRRRLEGWRNP